MPVSESTIQKHFGVCSIMITFPLISTLEKFCGFSILYILHLVSVVAMRWLDWNETLIILSFTLRGTILSSSIFLSSIVVSDVLLASQLSHSYNLSMILPFKSNPCAYFYRDIQLQGQQSYYRGSTRHPSLNPSLTPA